MDTLNARAATIHADVKMKDGRVLKGRRIHVSSDSISIASLDGKADSNWTLGRIESVTFAYHGKGFLEGLLLGFASGFGVGCAIGLASGDTPDRIERSFFTERTIKGTTAGEKARVGGVAGGILGGLLGGVVGGAAGSQVIYRFTDPVPR